MLGANDRKFLGKTLLIIHKNTLHITDHQGEEKHELHTELPITKGAQSQIKVGVKVFLRSGRFRGR